MSNCPKVIYTDELWDIFNRERELAWEDADTDIGSPEWNVSVGKIDVINHICEAVYQMNAAPRSDSDNAKSPIWKERVSIVHTDYADGTAKTEPVKWANWTCPVCGWFVGEQVNVNGRKHNQQKSYFCSRCGQRIDWNEVEGMKDG